MNCPIPSHVGLLPIFALLERAFFRPYENKMLTNINRCGIINAWGETHNKKRK